LWDIEKALRLKDWKNRDGAFDTERTRELSEQVKLQTWTYPGPAVGGPTQGANSVFFSRDSRHLITCNVDGTLCVLRLTSSKEKFDE
jgi:hypothetical protein